MIKYIIRSKKSPATKAVKYYVQVAPVDVDTLSEIIKRIEARCTVSGTDIKAVLYALEQEVLESLMNGRSVRLGELGSFRITLRSHGAMTPEEARKQGARMIRCANVQFTKSGAMRRALQLRNLTFTLQPDIHNAELEVEQTEGGE